MRNTKKNGFTIVELVIVIAVIAILSAILIPTFTNLVKNANNAALQSNLNGAYQEYTAAVAEKENYLSQDKVVFAKEVGSVKTYYVYNPTTQSYDAKTATEFDSTPVNTAKPTNPVDNTYYWVTEVQNSVFNTYTAYYLYTAA